MNTPQVYIVIALHLKNLQEIVSVHTNEDAAIEQCEKLDNNRPQDVYEYVYEEHRLVK